MHAYRTSALLVPISQSHPQCPDKNPDMKLMKERYRYFPGLRYLLSIRVPVPRLSYSQSMWPAVFFPAKLKSLGTFPVLLPQKFSYSCICKSCMIDYIHVDTDVDNSAVRSTRYEKGKKYRNRQYTEIKSFPAFHEVPGSTDTSATRDTTLIQVLLVQPSQSSVQPF